MPQKTSGQGVEPKAAEVKNHTLSVTDGKGRRKPSPSILSKTTAKRAIMTAFHANRLSFERVVELFQRFDLREA